MKKPARHCARPGFFPANVREQSKSHCPALRRKPFPVAATHLSKPQGQAKGRSRGVCCSFAANSWRFQGHKRFARVRQPAKGCCNRWPARQMCRFHTRPDFQSRPCAFAHCAGIRWPRRTICHSFARLVPPRCLWLRMPVFFAERAGCKARYSEYPAWPLEGRPVWPKTCLQYNPGGSCFCTRHKTIRWQGFFPLAAMNCQQARHPAPPGRFCPGAAP